MKGCKVGYIRVSSHDQNPERQLEGTELAHYFMYRQSGKNRDRPELQRMLQFIRLGDEIYVHSMDRLARNLEDLLHLVKQILDKGCTITFKKENLTFSNEKENPMAKLMLSVFGAIGEFERSLIKERQREGIEIAKRKGMYKGRPPVLTNSQIEEIKSLYPSHSKAAIARKFNVHVNTVSKHLPKVPYAGYPYFLKTNQTIQERQT